MRLPVSPRGPRAKLCSVPSRVKAPPVRAFRAASAALADMDASVIAHQTGYKSGNRVRAVVYPELKIYPVIAN